MRSGTRRRSVIVDRPRAAGRARHMKRALYYRLFGVDTFLGAQARSAYTVLDVGCSVGTGSVALEHRRTFGVDIHEESLRTARASGRRDPVVCADVAALPFKDAAFEIVAALDVLEHLDKDAGPSFVTELERVSSRVVVLLTPSGFDPQPGRPDQPWMEHRSGWSGAELADLGFVVKGWGGWRALRRPGAEGRFRFGPVGAGLAIATRRALRARPCASFHLLATLTR